MKYKREDRLKILEYKFIFEELIQVKKEYEEGASDLNYRLSFFREKLSTNPGQKDLYDQMFMGGSSSDVSEGNQVSLPDKQERSQSASKITTGVKPWAKKLYRKIVVMTHPDKTSEITSTHLKDKLSEQYRISQNAYENEIYSDLIMVAFDLNVPIPENVVDEELTPNTLSKKYKIDATKQLLGWRWFHVPDTQKDAELKKILSHYGFEFTDTQIKDVNKRKYIKRKPGTRPQRIKRFSSTKN